jgi:hypothetical protein
VDRDWWLPLQYFCCVLQWWCPTKMYVLLTFLHCSTQFLCLEPTGICCDNCLLKSNTDHPLLAKSNTAPHRPISPSSNIDDSPQQEADENGKQQMAEGAKVANCRDAHLKGAQELLEKWHIKTWLEFYCHWPWGHHCFLSDATKACFSSIDDLIDTGWSPTHSKKHGQEVLEFLKVYDNKFYKAREVEKLQKVEKWKQETARRQALKKAEKREAAKAETVQRWAEHESQPKKQQLSCAKKTPKVICTLADSSLILNSPVPFSKLAPSTPHPGHKNVSPRHVTPHMPWQPPAHFQPHYLLQMYTPISQPMNCSVNQSQAYVTPPHFTPILHQQLPTPITSPLPPAHFYSGCYPPPFLYPIPHHWTISEVQWTWTQQSKLSYIIIIYMSSSISGLGPQSLAVEWGCVWCLNHSLIVPSCSRLSAPIEIKSFDLSTLVLIFRPAV